MIQTSNNCSTNFFILEEKEWFWNKKLIDQKSKNPCSNILIIFGSFVIWFRPEGRFLVTHSARNVCRSLNLKQSSEYRIFFFSLSILCLRKTSQPKLACLLFDAIDDTLLFNTKYNEYSNIFHSKILTPNIFVCIITFIIFIFMNTVGYSIV